MEFIATKTIPTATLVASNPDSNDPKNANNLEFVFPAGFVRWTIEIVPRDSAANPAPTADVKYWTGKDYLSTNPATSATCVNNKANVITREDAISKILVTIRNGGSVVNGGVDVTLYGTRVSQ